MAPGVHGVERHLLQVPHLDRHRHGGTAPADRTEAGDQPPPNDLNPVPGEKEGRRDVVHSFPLDGVEVSRCRERGEPQRGLWCHRSICCTAIPKAMTPR
nr:hypothetical protein GCM10010200_049370 [Actinomadura rugatobispora]